MKNFKLNREDVLFMFIDIQDKLLEAVFNKEQILKNARLLADVCHIAKLPNLITVQYPKGLGYMNAHIKENLSDLEEFDKVYFSSMKDEKICANLEEFDKKQIVICGIETHVCVFQTARGLINAGYEVFLASDAVGSRSQYNHDNAIEMMRDMGVIITNSETILFDIAEKAGTDEFKKMQNLIK